MVEFTDYQCPYCRRFEAETWPLLKHELRRHRQAALHRARPAAASFIPPRARRLKRCTAPPSRAASGRCTMRCSRRTTRPRHGAHRRGAPRRLASTRRALPPARRRHRYECGDRAQRRRRARRSATRHPGVRHRARARRESLHGWAAAWVARPYEDFDAALARKTRRCRRRQPEPRYSSRCCPLASGGGCGRLVQPHRARGDRGEAHLHGAEALENAQVDALLRIGVASCSRAGHVVHDLELQRRVRRSVRKWQRSKRVSGVASMISRTARGTAASVADRRLVVHVRDETARAARACGRSCARATSGCPRCAMMICSPVMLRSRVLFTPMCSTVPCRSSTREEIADAEGLVERDRQRGEQIARARSARRARRRCRRYPSPASSGLISTPRLSSASSTATPQIDEPRDEQDDVHRAREQRVESGGALPAQVDGVAHRRHGPERRLHPEQQHERDASASARRAAGRSGRARRATRPRPRGRAGWCARPAARSARWRGLGAGAELRHAGARRAR